MARHRDHPDRFVVLKVPRNFGDDCARSDEATRLLRSEARVLCTLNHPRIVRFLELVEGSPRDFIVMEFAAGGCLADKLKKLHDSRRDGFASQRVAEAASLLLDILQALEYVHLKGVLHLDIT